MIINDFNSPPITWETLSIFFVFLLIFSVICIHLLIILCFLSGLSSMEERDYGDTFLDSQHVIEVILYALMLRSI